MSNKREAVQSNVFYDTFDEMFDIYTECKKEIWEETKTVTLYDAPYTVGLFPKSDIIIVYDNDTLKPTIVTERLYRKDYTFVRWLKLKSYLRHKTKLIKQELGYNVRISYAKDYIDYVHYKEEWWQWALKQKQQQS